MKKPKEASFQELRKEWQSLFDKNIPSTPPAIPTNKTSKSRRRFPNLFIVFPSLLFIAFFAFHYLAGKQPIPASPNIIFILTDDQRWDALGFAGNKYISTPEMDQLAKDGLYFANSFATTPTCTSSRASILSCVYEYQHRYGNFSDSIDTRLLRQSYPRLLKQKGYTTGFYGKFGVKYDSLSLLFDHFENYSIKTEFPDKRGYFYKKINQDTVHTSTTFQLVYVLPKNNHYRP